MDVYRVSAITATVGGPTTILLSKNAFTSDWVLSHSILVQHLLLDAFFTGGPKGSEACATVSCTASDATGHSPSTEVRRYIQPSG
jgi:hypothetical protein